MPRRLPQFLLPLEMRRNFKMVDGQQSHERHGAETLIDAREEACLFRQKKLPGNVAQC